MKIWTSFFFFCRIDFLIHTQHILFVHKTQLSRNFSFFFSDIHDKNCTEFFLFLFLFWDKISLSDMLWVCMLSWYFNSLYKMKVFTELVFCVTEWLNKCTDNQRHLDYNRSWSLLCFFRWPNYLTRMLLNKI